MFLHRGKAEPENKTLLAVFGVLIVSLGYFFTYFFIESNAYLIAVSLFVSLYFFFLWMEKDPFSPLVIFGLFLLLYSISFPLLYHLDDTLVSSDRNALIIVTSGFLIYVGLVVSCVLFSFLGLGGAGVPLFAGLESNKAKQVLGVFLFPLGVLFLYILYLAFSSGAETKTELSKGLGGIGGAVYLFLFYLFVFCGIKYRETGNRYFLVLFVVPFLAYYLIAGHRDLVVRSLLMVLLILYLNSGISKKGVVLILLAGVAAVPISQAGKGLLSYSSNFEFQLTFESFFSGEFVSQGRNFNWLLESSGLVGHVYENMIVNDFLRFLYLAPHSSGSIFGSDFIGRTGGAGLGFTLPGELYFSGSYLALVFYGFVSGLVMLYFKNRSGSVVGVAVYVMILFAFSYSLRADLANLLSGVVKLSIAPAIILFLIVNILPSRRRG